MTNQQEENPVLAFMRGRGGPIATGILVALVLGALWTWLR